MVNENIGPIKAVKLSAKLIAKSWRRTFGVNSLLALPLLVLLLVLYLLGVHEQYSAKGVIIYLLVVVGYFILLMPFMSALNGIISTAIYLNNIKEVKLNGFDREVLSNALEPRQSKYF